MKSGKSYCPDRGDIVWLSFSPQKGHEQSGLRPALTISPIEYNKKTNLAIFCPITSKKKGYPFEVLIKTKKKIGGVVLSDQIKSLDWNARKSKFITTASKQELHQVLEHINILLEI
jgi:mRNA interferase MazF